MSYRSYAVYGYENRPKSEWEFLGYDDDLGQVPQQRWLNQIAGDHRFAFRSNDLAAPEPDETFTVNIKDPPDAMRLSLKRGNAQYVDNFRDDFALGSYTVLQKVTRPRPRSPLGNTASWAAEPWPRSELKR